MSPSSAHAAQPTSVAESLAISIAVLFRSLSTVFIFHAPSDWLKEVQPRNIASMLVTLLTSQSLMKDWLKEVQKANIPLMSVTCESSGGCIPSLNFRPEHP